MEQGEFCDVCDGRHDQAKHDRTLDEVIGRLGFVGGPTLEPEFAPEKCGVVRHSLLLEALLKEQIAEESELIPEASAVHFPNERVYRYTEADYLGTDLRGAALMSSAHPGDGVVDEDTASRQRWYEMYCAGVKLLGVYLEDNNPEPDILSITRDIARGN